MKSIVLVLSLIFSVNSFSKSQKIISKDLKKVINMKKKHNKKIASLILESSKKYSIDPKLIMSIIAVESNFDQAAQNKNGCKYINFKKNCGDYSLAQINYLVWKEELRKYKENLDLEKLKKSNAYAIDRMSLILSILKKRHSKKDKLWFTRYNSGNYLKKIRYLRMLEYRLKRIGYKIDYQAKEKLLYLAVRKHGWKKVMGIYTKIPSVKLKI